MAKKAKIQAFILRLPADTHARLLKQAEAHGRSANKEAVFILKKVLRRVSLVE